MAPTLHSKNGRGNTFFTERRHSERSGVGLTGSYETPRIAQAEVRKKCANSILVRMVSVTVLGKKNHTGEGSETTRPPLRLCKRSRFDFYKKQNCAQMMKLHKHQAFMLETAKFTRRCICLICHHERRGQRGRGAVQTWARWWSPRFARRDDHGCLRDS